MSGRRRGVWCLAWALILAACAGERAPVEPPLPAAPVAAPAPPPTPAPLAFVETVTAGADAARPLPLIIAVHGLGDRPENFVRLFDGLPFAARVVAPRGPIAHGRGYSWFPVQIPVRRDDARTAEGLRGAAGELAALAAWLSVRRPTVGRPIITGFSQGGMSSFAVAVHHPDAISGAVPVAGALPSALWSGPGPSVPVVALHGESDRVVPFADAAALVEALAARGGVVRLQPFPGVAHRIPPTVRRALYEALAELAPVAVGPR